MRKDRFFLGIVLISAVGFAQTTWARRETGRGQQRPPNAIGGSNDKGVEIGRLETELKNPQLGKELKEVLEKCLKDVLCQEDPLTACSIEVMDKECRSQAAQNANAASGRGSANSCHGCQNSPTPRAVDLGSITCDGQQYGPSASGEASDYYFEIAMCMNGDDFKRGNCGRTPAAVDQAAQQQAKQRKGGVCYHHSCYASGQNLVGNCPAKSHGDHIHFSGDGCGHGEKTVAPQSPKSQDPPAAGCGKEGSRQRMPRNGMKQST